MSASFRKIYLISFGDIKRRAFRRNLQSVACRNKFNRHKKPRVEVESWRIILEEYLALLNDQSPFVITLLLPLLLLFIIS